MRDELEAGIKNAIERGSTLEDAIQSFINAGYNPVEVKEAANNLNGASNMLSNNSIPQKNPQPPSRPVASVFGVPLQSTPQAPLQNKPFVATQDKSKSKVKLIIILLVVFLVILVGAMVALILFREKILDLIKPSQLTSLFYGI